LSQKVAVRLVLILTLTTFSGYFILHYFALVPSKGANWYGFADRLLFSYLQSYSSERVVVVNSSPRDEFLSLAFYNGVLPELVQKADEDLSYSHKNISIVEHCPSKDSYDVLVVTRINTDCGNDSSIYLFDATKTWRISGDLLCVEHSNEIFTYSSNWRDLSTTNGVTIHDLCKRWFYRERVL
jgi:hypothetical protein